MLKTLSRFTSSFASLLSDPATEVDADGRIEDIRAAMMYQLTMIDDSSDCSYVWSCVVRASDVQALWYLRCDLVSALADSVGEPAAREKVEPITEMFRGLVPRQYMKSLGTSPKHRSS